MKILIMVAGLFLISGCKSKDDGKTTNSGRGDSANSGTFTCECVKGGAVESISAKNPREAQTTCSAKGEGYKLKKCSRNK